MRKTLGPFPGLQGLSVIDVNTADPLDILERHDLINGCLASEGCNCNGHAAGSQRDQYWGADLSELVARCTPHDVHMINVDDKPVTVNIGIKLETLRVEVDDNREICTWLYEES